MLLAVGPVVVSFAVSWLTGDGQWFQRSGSLMVLFSVAVESRRRQLQQAGNPVGRGTWLFWRQIPYICYLSIFMGTLIWGYGDLLFEAMI